MPASCGCGLKHGFQKRTLTPQAFHPHRRRVAAAKPRLAAYPTAPPTAPKAAALSAAARAGARRAKRGMIPPCCRRPRFLLGRPLGQCRRRRPVGILVWLAPPRSRSLL